MDAQKRLDLITAKPIEEVVTAEDLKEAVESGKRLKHYIGLEISGLLHAGSLLVNGQVINNLLKAGVECTVYLADWHSVINNKLEGDWEKIGRASQYYEEAFKFHCPGVKIVRGSDLYHDNDGYWRDVIAFSKHVTLARGTRCLTIMGRTEKEAVDVAKYFYPPMQAVDIKALGVDIAHAGTDQRKVHMLAREVFPKMGWKPPIALHHHLLAGLQEPPKTGNKEEDTAASKMSKSKPDSAIFVHDSPDTIKAKMKKAFCPERVVEGNPVIEFAEYIVFANRNTLDVKRPAKFGGDVSFASPEELKKAFAEGKLHPADLKNSVAEALDEIIAPTRSHFEKKKDLLSVYGEVSITR